ncbi:MAG: TolC family protein [Syntrophobacteraceae bacterium]
MRTDRLLSTLIVLGMAALLARPAAGADASLPAQPLTEQNAVAFGLEHNRALMAAKKDVAAAGQKVKQSQADYYPKVDASYRFTHLSDQPVVGFGGGTFFPGGYTNTNRWEVQLTQPLFTGFARSSQLKISRMDESIAKYRMEEARLDFVRDIRHAFWQTILGEKLLQVARENVNSLQVQRRNAEANYQQGLTARNDVLKAEVALSQAVQRERSTLKQVVMLRSRLNQVLGIDLQTTLTLAGGDIAPGPLPPLEHFYAAAEKQRPEYLSVGTSIQQADQAIKAARSRYYPHLSAFAQYYREGEDFTADRNIYTNSDNTAVGVRMDWNLFEGGKTDAAAREWLYKRQALEERQRDLKEQIRLQVEDAYEQLHVAMANIDTAQAALDQAKENERMTTLQYKEQLVIFLEVLNAQVFVSQSQADYYQALYGYRIASSDLERATGGPAGQ